MKKEKANVLKEPFLKKSENLPDKIKEYPKRII